jgi:type I restriction enzyme S subunit
VDRDGRREDGDVPEGYKRTEMGVIPEDWECRQLRQLMIRPPTYGINAAAISFNESYPTYIRITDIDEQGRFVPDPLVSVNHRDASRFLLKEGDIVFARTGASVGKSYEYRPSDGVLVFAGFLIRITPGFNNLNSTFLFNYCHTHRYWSWVESVSVRSGQPGINATEYGSLHVPVPPISEQRAIAEALSDADRLIESLDKLIAKKRAVKQAAMQQLLTGKTRLPGFSGEWETKRLGEVADVKTGPFGSALHESDYVEDGTPIITVEHLGDVGVIHANLPRVSAFHRNTLKMYTLEVGDVVFSRVGSIDRNALISSDERGWLFSGRLLRVRPYVRSVSGCFLSYQFSFEEFRTRVRQVAVGQTMPSLNTEILKGIPVTLPSSAEQTAIATVLSDMDDEITALEKRRDKAKAVKQGMMQELLTGRIRLVEPETRTAG